MNLVVCDANVLFAGLLDPDSLYRKILCVLAYGNLRAQREAAEAERQAVEQFIAENSGATVHGLPDHQAIEARCERRILRMEEYMPALVPTDWGLVTSAPITEEVFHNAVAPRSALGGQSEAAARTAVAIALTIAAVQVTRGLDGVIPLYTQGRDVKDDPIIHTAILARAEWVLSQDKRHVSLSTKRPTVYEDAASGRQAGAITLSYFIRKLLCTGLHFDEDDLREIDGDDALKAAIA